MVVLDTSVVAKWFIEEEGSDRAAKIREEFLSGSAQIVLCDLTLYELGNLLKFKGFSPSEIDSALGSLFDLGVDIVALPKPCLELQQKLQRNMI